MFTMEATRSVAATFTLAPEVTVTPEGEGGMVMVEVISNSVQAGAVKVPARVGAVAESFPFGTLPRLTAVPWLGYPFDGWGGDSTGDMNLLQVT